MRVHQRNRLARTLLARAGAGVALSLVLLITGCDFGVTEAGEQSPPPSPGAENPPPDGGEPPGEEDSEQAADGAEAPPLMLVMDASGSMNEEAPDGGTRLDAAKQALRDLVTALPDGQQVGLRVYGHRVPNTDEERGCQDTELIHPIAPLDREGMLSAIDGYEAVGFTPIGLSLREAAGDLPPEGARSIILVSDGEDTCAPPEPCEVAEELAGDGVDLVMHTVGFALDDNEQARSQLECIAEAGGGEFHDVDTAPELAETLEGVTERDRRQVEIEGSVLEGAPIPQQANTGQVDVQYTDTVLSEEDNYYRFEVSPGTELRAEVLFAGTEAFSCRSDVGGLGGMVGFGVSITDEEGRRNDTTGVTSGWVSQPKVAETDQNAVATGDEVYLLITNSGCPEDASFELQFQVITV